MWHAYAPTPIGDLLLIANEEGLLRIEFPPASPPDDAPPDERRLTPAIRQIAAFFEGGRKIFDVPLALRGTPFQLAVWRELLRIPYGETRTYAEIAAVLRRRGRSAQQTARIRFRSSCPAIA